ncbi:hypothetical protein ACNQVK_04685 [Mycobacterium sp. 134]|uniref:hypothetical protein n=1 Tax=Mycobacteriaceae TaxID=1762 RepID=UPI003AAA9E22
MSRYDVPTEQGSREIVERETRALAMLVERADVSEQDLEATRRVLRKLASVQFEDLLVLPGFVLLPDWEVSRANTHTPEWKFYQAAKTFTDDADYLEVALGRVQRRQSK